MSKYFYLLLLAVLFSSCNEYQKALKSDDVKYQYDVAVKLYEEGKYNKVITLAEKLKPVLKGKPSAQKLFYVYAKSMYFKKQYYNAAYEFGSFVNTYPKSDVKEEAAFLAAKSRYMLSPVYSKDQADTYVAVSALQSFIDTYPDSQYMDEANQLAKELREKLEKKAFEIAKQYHLTADFFGDYAAAIKTFDNFLIDFPGTKLKEDALYYKFDSSYRLAMNSIASKKQERLEDAISNYKALVKFNGETKYRKEVDEMFASIETELQKFSK
ncbi:MULTISPECIES: outer membrane protein assembly factor BamD [Flavobacterium]|uniref:Lipoprotein n=1 Tax=Flavobacterium beibuense F44-8 TaxID=1406840 RepID=A0A0A2LQP1_9FLAO|nr:outer membrane protein assembly factor BamD [Flavobacterium beibuense]KGO81548.1 lipoprotein [Flavobacterium beibuense F44-8]